MIAKHYFDFYHTSFGRKILEWELAFIQSELAGCKHVLSVGCGPAILEARLVQLSPTMAVIGLDNSREMLAQSPEHATVVLGDVEYLSFKDRSFDCVLYLTSLEFIDEYERAVKETMRVLRPKGNGLFLILNPESRYFEEEYNDEHSYIRKYIKHTDIKEIKAFISRYFFIETGYFLGIKDGRVFDTNDRELASLYLIKGVENGKHACTW